MEFRFDEMLCFNLGKENSDAGHIKYSSGPNGPAGCRFTTHERMVFLSIVIVVV